MGAIVTYVTVAVVDNNVKAAIKRSEEIAHERLDGEPGVMVMVSREVVVVGKTDVKVGTDDEGNDIMKAKLDLEVRAIYRKDWEDEASVPSTVNVPKDPNQDHSEAA